MKLIKPGFEIIDQPEGLDGIYKQIEIAGRTCYKSEDKITEDSAKLFVDRMIKSGHGAMLEHGTVYLKIPIRDDTAYRIDSYTRNPYSKAYINKDLQYYLITTNYRVLVEKNWLNDLQYVCEPTEFYDRRVTVKFTCDRGVSHEFVRHRVFSFAMESTRYCNYSKDKFGNEISFIIPTWLDEEKLKQYGPYHLVTRDTSLESIFIAAMNNSERDYFELLKQGWKPQQARQVLPNALKTELVMTGFLSDWRHFFELRCAPSAHPDAQYLAKELLKELYNRYPYTFKDLYEKFISTDTLEDTTN